MTLLLEYMLKIFYILIIIFFKSDKNNNILIYNKENSLFVNRDEIINYRICDLPPQVLMGMELFIESTTDNGLSSNDTVCLHLKIS